MGDVHRKRGSQDERLTRNLAPDRFAYISDSTYTEAQVVEMTATIQDCTTDDLRTSPNSKMFLRSFWYRLVQASVVSSEEMHIYTLSRCFCHHHQLHLPAVAPFLLRASLLRQSNASILELLSEALSRPLFIPVVKMCIYDGFASPTRDCSLPAVSIGLTCLDHHIAPLSITMVQWKTLLRQVACTHVYRDKACTCSRVKSALHALCSDHQSGCAASSSSSLFWI